MSVDITATSAPATADEKLLALLRSELLIAREILKSFVNLLTSEDKKSLLIKILDEVNRYKNQVESHQQDFLSYFSRVAPSLSNREEWMGIFSKISGIVDKLGGLAHRIEFLLAKSQELPRPTNELLVKMITLLISMTDSYISMMNNALQNRARTFEARSEVSKNEKEMDTLYRRVIFDTLEANLPPLVTLLLLNIAEMIEDVADLLNSAADDLYLVTLYATT